MAELEFTLTDGAAEAEEVAEAAGAPAAKVLPKFLVHWNRVPFIINCLFLGKLWVLILQVFELLALNLKGFEFKTSLFMPLLVPFIMWTVETAIVLAFDLFCISRRACFTYASKSYVLFSM
uniref:Uncharacterized protein n=1 Tax=Cacopsylla melanoneura TaxID=428564 RepID=A0A8D9AZ68_9HEMI